MRRPRLSRLFALALVALAACGDDNSPDETAGIDPVIPPPMVVEGRSALTIVVADGGHAGLEAASADLADAIAEITGVGPERVTQTADVPADHVIVRVAVSADATSLGAEGYALRSGALSDGRVGIDLTAATHVGAMYGLYALVGDLGVRYLHPEESFFPNDPTATLPWDYDGSVVEPGFEARGFHEHTQHPIVMSDVYLRPEPRFRDYASRYLRWMARNRQNRASFHMLKTVDLDTWRPWITDIIAEADGYGIDMGCVIGFVDQQQNAFKLIRDDVDEDGQPVPDEVQIQQRLDGFLDAGFDFITLQIGSSEFTKPADSDTLRWIQTVVDRIDERSPETSLYIWIHITCDLEGDDIEYYFHLPLQSAASVGAWVHTTMFYTLDHPAPVYSCESFAHQIEFMEQADGTREQVFFPETAWWLGFDNNLPLAMPITGWSRAYDIQELLPNHDVTGHVTFTTGREWDYWQYDHYLTAATWDRSLGWDDYLAWVAPAYGENAEAWRQATVAWTALQVRHFYEENPLIYFYLAGELPQDESGAQAGILARRPKLAFREVAAFSDERFAAWMTDDYEMLERMLVEYREVLDAMPAAPQAESPSVVRYAQSRRAFELYVLRIEHAIELYGAVIDVRAYQQLESPTEEETAGALAEVEAKLATARGLSAQAIALILAGEATYRYPAELLTEPKPESPTSYAFGYLEDTHRGYFWTRRDDQLERLIGIAFDTIPQEWPEEPTVVYVATGDGTEVTEPANPLAGQVISGFMPNLLFGWVPGDVGDRVHIAQDFDDNGLPDADTVGTFADEGDGALFVAEYTLLLRSNTGELFGELALLDATIVLAPSHDAAASATVDGEISSDQLIATMTSIDGLDPEAAVNLVRTVFGGGDGAELADRLPVSFTFTFEVE